MYSIELNNARRDNVLASGNIKENSPCVEIFSAMVDGKENVGGKYSKAVVNASEKYIKDLYDKASVDDNSAKAELNQMRVFAMQPRLLQEIKLLSAFGSYKPLAWGDTAYLETTDYENITANIQGEGLDVPTGFYRTKRVALSPITISSGYKVDYRTMQYGDFRKENELKNQVLTEIRNKATLYVMKTVLNEIKNANGVKYFYENAGLTKASVDGLLTKIRRYGRPNVSGDYALISQFTQFAGYDSTVGNALKIFSEKQLNEIADNGVLGSYNGSLLNVVENGYNYSKIIDKNGDKSYDTLLPAGLAIVSPTANVKGVTPIQSFAIGGLTSMTGNSVSTGDVLTRFDMSIACGVAKDHYGNVDGIGIIHDTNLDDLANE